MRVSEPVSYQHGSEFTGSRKDLSTTPFLDLGYKEQIQASV